MNNEKHYCEINENGFALATGVVTGIAYTICAVFVALWPSFILRLFGWLTHLVNVNKFIGDIMITFGGFLIGLAQVVIYSYVGAWFIAWIYNKFCGVEK